MVGLEDTGTGTAAGPDTPTSDPAGSAAAEPGTAASEIADPVQPAAGESSRDAQKAPDRDEPARTAGTGPARDDEHADYDEDREQADRGAAQVALPLARKPRRRPAAVPSDLPPFSPAARPAWTPMQVRPTVRKTAGVTVFGTRLTYRQAAIGAAALLVVVLLVIVLAAKAFSGGDRDKAASPGSVPTTAPAGGGPAAGHAPSGTPSSQPSSAPSSHPTSASPATGNNITLPAGWHWYTRPTQSNWPGFTIPLPQNATFSFDGSQIFIRWNNRLLLVDRTNTPNPDPVKDWRDLEGNSSYRDYHRIKIVPVSYFKGGADWEFMYTTDNGNPQHVDKRNIEFSATAAYSLNWYTSPEDWAAGQSDIQLIYRGFQPRP